MAQGYFTGLLCGSAVSLLGLGTISLASKQPAGSVPPSSPEVTAPDIADATEQSNPDEIVPDVATDPGGAPAPSVTPGVETPGRIIPQVQTNTDPLPQPDTGEVTSGLALPDVTDTPVVGASLDEPVLPNPQGLAPVVPDQERDVVLDTSTAAVPEGDAAQQDAPSDTTEAETLDADDPTPSEPVNEVSDVEPDQSTATDTDTDTDAAAEDAEAANPEPAGNADPVIALDTETPLLPGAQAQVLVPQTPDPIDPTPTPAPAEDSAAQADGDALTRFAADFTVPAGVPMMSVILIDDGLLSGAEGALANIPFAVTIALSPTTENAKERMRGYRDAGIEVIALAEIPDGALPSDAEVILEAGFAELPEAIGLLDIGQAGLQSDRPLADQAMARLAADGRGFVTQSRGLNTGLRSADSGDVPAAVVYRDIDEEAQEARIIRRFLDQAAFRARQQSGVILVGRVRPETISALALWGAANATGQIALAPVSAILNGR